MTNDWGCVLVQERTSFHRSAKTMIDLDGEIRKSVPGFQLQSLVHSGSNANVRAIDFATGGHKSRCLIAMGSYVAGCGGPLQDLSSSCFDASHYICEIVCPEGLHPSESQLLKQTVAFPYFVSHPGLCQEELKKIEHQCLQSIELKLWTARLCREPFQALLMEPILSGNGGELTDNFLTCLSRLLKRFNVSVVLDEIMTCGRAGPKMTVSAVLPKEFLEIVGYITVGKIFGGGMVLQKRPKRPTDITNKWGESTSLNAGEAYLKWRVIQERIEQGAIPARRALVLRMMGMEETDNRLWGRGCLIFSSKARPGVLKNLKCRLLPMLEINVKLQKGKTKNSGYGRKVVCEMLLKSAKEWLEATHCFEFERSPPFLGPVADYIVRNQPDVIFTEDILHDMGNDAAESMARKFTQKNNPGKAHPYPKKPKSYINELLLRLSHLEPTLLLKTRKQKRRKQGYVITYNNL